MNFAYRKHRIEIISTFDTLYRKNLTPIVEITCNDPAGFPHYVTTNRWFETANDAEQFGFSMAKEWIDQHFTKVSHRITENVELSKRNQRVV